MTRPLRIEYKDAYYHVMNRGLNGRSIFEFESHYEMFLKLLQETWQRFGVEIHAYCLLSNHYHLLLQTPLGNLSRIMRHIDGVYTQEYNRRTKKDGPLFRGRYKAILIEEDHYLEQVSRYIHLNPVKATIVQKAEQYKWSSYEAYLKEDKCPEWLNVGQILNQTNSNNAREKYHDFVGLDVEDEIEKFYTNENQGSILGSKDFKILKIKQLNSKVIQASSPDIRRTREVPSVDEIIALIAHYYQRSISEIKEGKRGTKNVARVLAMLISSHHYGHKIKTIADQYGVTSSVVSVLISRMKRRLRKDKELREECVTLVNWLVEQYKL